MATRPETLARELEVRVQEALATLQQLSDEDWKKVTEAEGWTVAATAHHLAGALEPVSQMVQALAAGQWAARFTSAMLDDMNARHARDFADCSRAETVALLRKNAAVAAAAIRGMSDEALARSGTVLADRPPMTVEQLIMTALINHVDEHFGSIRRTARHSQVGRTIFALPSDREIAVTRGVAAPRDVVWKAWTSPDSVARWMLGPEGWTMPVCEIDLRPGGAWHFVWRTQAGETMEMRGVYQEVVPPARLVTIESWGGDWPETFNTLALAEENGIVTMTSTVRYPSREARDAALGTGMKDGWAASYDRLAAYLASGARP